MARLTLVFVLIVGVYSCTGGTDTVVQDLSSVPDVAEVDAGLPDSMMLPDIPSRDDVPKAQDMAPDFNIEDQGAEVPTQQCAAGEGCFLDQCEGNADCQSGWCVQHLGESVCSQMCQEECPQGWTCKQVAGTDPDVVYICVSDYANLCRPCDSNTDCMSAGGAQDACVDYGDDGDFCGGACGPDGNCPWGFSCQEAQSVEGAPLTQCVNDTGECPCTANSVAVGLATSCLVNNEFGICHGKRICGEEGLSECNADVPQPEVCNGFDEDCDDEIDEPNLVDGAYLVLCDDENACTEDSCSGPEGCVNVVLETGDCNDGNPCTVADHCDEGACVGDPVECDDENPCTENICTETGGCDYAPIAGICDDGDPCTMGDQCDEGQCAGTPVSCDCQEDAECTGLEDGDLCNGTLFCDQGVLPFKCSVDPETVVTCPQPEGTGAICLQADCDGGSGECGFKSANEGLLCGDGDSCTSGSVCVDGACQGGGVVNCNDGNMCTDDSCNPETGCQHQDNEVSCNDGDACTVDDACLDGQCEAAGPLGCDDGDVCNGQELCDSLTGCTPGTPLVCDDGDPCNGIETCDPAAGCQPGIETNCNDGNPCTDETCDPENGCVYSFNVAACNDGDACTIGDACGNGQCGSTQLQECDDEDVCNGQETCDSLVGCQPGIPLLCEDNDVCNGVGTCDPQQGCASGIPLDCEDGNPCSGQQCDPDVGCLYEPVEGPCDDGNECTEIGECVGGQCVAGAVLECDDQDICTTDGCNPLQGCTHSLNEAPCDDADLCTTGDHCHLGECIGGMEIPCDDGNDCTADSCDADGGCQFVPTDGNCDDGSKCTFGDHCVGGNCVVTGFENCDDSNPCTDDACDDALGCVNDANADSCSDGTVCTVGDLCVDKECVPGIPMICNDSNLCTDDTCDVLLACVFTNNAMPCNDEDLCTPFDNCSGGQCVGSGEVNCDDENPCTDDSCAPESGCVNAPNSLGCTDDDECTVIDVCEDSVCVPGVPLDCDDLNTCTIDDCDPQAGCTHVPLPDGDPCEGGNICWAGECTTPCIPGSQTFNYSGGEQTFVVPSGCDVITVDAYGGKGGCPQGGNGGRAKGNVPVTSGETLYVLVGGHGQCNSAIKSGAFNGGGATVYSNGYANGEGGGASDLRRGGNGKSNRVLVAGGGGGRGWGGDAGDGGGDVGQAANTSGGGCGGPCNGKGGSQNAGGEGGKCGGSCWGTSGTSWKGGTGAACSACGGGGGGGYYGGGGGGHCSAGGGSSFFGPGVSKDVNQQGANSGAGKIIISW